MQFKIDENLPVDVADRLREAGYDAMTVCEQNLGGEPDTRIADMCQRESRCLLTLDKDFSDIRTYPPEQFSGIIILRVKQQDRTTVLELLEKLLMLIPLHPVEQQLWIVEDRRVRVRGVLNTDIIQ